MNGHNTGININAIAPGYMATNNNQSLRETLFGRKQFLTEFRPAMGLPQDLKGPRYSLPRRHRLWSTPRARSSMRMLAARIRRGKRNLRSERSVNVEMNAVQIVAVLWRE